MVLIREANAADLPAILHIYAQPDLDEGVTLPLEEAIEIYSKFTRYPYYQLYIAENQKIIVGTFALLIMDNLAHQGARSGIIEDVGVLPEYHGQGVGKKMMEYAMAECTKAGCYKVSVSSNLNRLKTHAFYESLEFKKHGHSFLLEIVDS